MTEDDLEQLALTWCQDSSWEYRFGPDIAQDGDTPDRADYRQGLMQGCLHERMLYNLLGAMKVENKGEA